MQERDRAAVAPAVWARDVCTTVGEWSAGIEAAAAGVPAALGPTPGLAEGKAAVSGFLATALEGTDALLMQLDDAGAPDVVDGADVAAATRDGITGVRDGLGAAQSAAEALPVDDPTGFQASLIGVRDAILGASNEAGEALDQAVTRFEVPKLDQALRAEPACQALEAIQPFATE